MEGAIYFNCPTQKAVKQSHPNICCPDLTFFFFFNRQKATRHTSFLDRDKYFKEEKLIPLSSCVTVYRFMCVLRNAEQFYFLFSSMLDYGLQSYRKEDSPEGSSSYQQHFIQVYIAPEIHSLSDFEPNSMTDVYR